ncbi:ankyrin repeat and LEM domain-containing protein 2 homolog [Plodia interpunctella]|uniref:ankyrin repeat and LEM domain-containing protein 2 homolog n=1 Tax=Plodia interpunctella TaxID=58824 RepID=UPI0023682DE2|nr:ankyrin repeat and LEM domain-containing protein 2 homolog [Plodia interpunctella]
MSKAVIIPECNKNFGGMKDEISISPTDKKDGAIGLFSRLLRFDSLKRNPAPESPTNTEPPTTYYGVYIPCEIKKGPDEEALHVYKNKSEALELVRRYKLARFKAFQNRQDAVSFALRGAEPVDTVDGNDNSVVGEKPYPFKAPSPQDMVSLRKNIEAGHTANVRERVWENPRFLVSSGNTPSIMHEGTRYNAMHVAAKSGNAEMCNMLLTTVGDPSFVQTLYGADADSESCKEFAAILLDRYLNTPDKSMNETPLHFAAKFGAEEVVDVLTSFPQCNRAAVNKFGEQAKDIICKRASTTVPETSGRIASMLRERYYVPVLHCEDGSEVPTIGRPFSPAQPPDINVDPLTPRYEIRAFAGPMEAARAESFRRKWKTPPRAAHPHPRALAPPTFRLREMTKGLEAVGRNLAEEMNVGWKEYWPFLDTFTDLRTPEGLALLENYLRAKYEDACSFAYSDSCVEHSPVELSISRLSLGNISQISPIKDNMSPMSELCVALKTCKISSDKPHWRKTDPMRQRLCRQPSIKHTIENGMEPSPVINHTVNQLLCIERTCQVFAKRIADALVFSLTAEPEVAGDSLKSEAKHLQHTMYTYMDDERFKKIDFALIHSRLAQLVVYKLKQQTTDLDDINNLVEFLIKLRCPNDDIFSSDDERKPMYRDRISRVKMTYVIDGHVRCVASFICEELTETDTTKGPAVSEVECIEIWEKAAKCRCDWKIEAFERNSKKNASFRKNRSILSTSPKSDGFIRRLTFDYDIGDGASARARARSSAPPRADNSPAGDSAPLHSPLSAPLHAPLTKLYALDVSNCQLVAAEISEDESVASCQSEQSDEEDFLTASEYSDREDMEEASEAAIAEPFIYGDQPSKMDRLVYEAVSQCAVDRELFPSVYRWRHTVALYSPAARDTWKPSESLDRSSICGESQRAATLSSTPNKTSHADTGHRAPTLQVSNWLRVTGPNSPRSVLAAKNVGHNVSFGF